MGYCKVRPRGGIEEDWTSKNPILAEQEIAFEYEQQLKKENVKMKQGDGVTPWNDLPYAIMNPVDIGEKKTIIDARGNECITELGKIETETLTGKKMIANVVGGSSTSSFQQLANNAETIKTQRDTYAIEMNNLTGQVNSLNTQVSNMTKDRDNWKTLANSRKTKYVKTFSSYDEVFKLQTPMSPSSMFAVIVYNGYGSVQGFMFFKMTSNMDAIIATLSGMSAITVDHHISYDSTYIQYSIPNCFMKGQFMKDGDKLNLDMNGGAGYSCVYYM